MAEKSSRKHWKRRNCLLRFISPFPTVFSKGLYWRHIKTRACLGKGYTFTTQSCVFTVLRKRTYENIVGNEEKTDKQPMKFRIWQFLYPRIERSGHIVLPLSVCLYVHLSVYTNLTQKLNIFLLFLNLFSFKARIQYKCTSHQYTSAGTKVKVICKGQGQISRSYFSMSHLGGMSVSQTNLGYYFFL